MIKRRFIEHAKTTLTNWQIGTEIKSGKRVYFIDAIHASGMTIDEYCRHLVECDLTQGIDSIAFILGEFRIEGESCPEPREIAIAIVASLQNPAPLPDGSSDAQTADWIATNGQNEGASFTRMFRLVFPDRESLNKSLVSGSVGLLVLDPVSALLVVAFSYVMARAKLI